MEPTTERDRSGKTKKYVLITILTEATLKMIDIY